MCAPHSLRTSCLFWMVKADHQGLSPSCRTFCSSSRSHSTRSTATLRFSFSTLSPTCSQVAQMMERDLAWPSCSSVESRIPVLM